MKRKLLLTLIAIHCIVMQAWAYDFSAVNSDGMTIYYNITSSTPPYQVEVTGESTSYCGTPSYSGIVNLPSSVTYNGITYSVISIGKEAFYFCSNVTDITIPNSVVSLGVESFQNCRGLSTINIPNSLQSIGNYAFCNCSNLTSISIPASVTSLAGNAFAGCSGINSIVVASGNPVYDSRSNCNAVIEKSTNKLIVGCNSTIIPNSVTSIGNEAFVGCTGITELDIPNSVTSIGWYAFRSCTNLASIVIPTSVTSIVGSAFAECSSINSITVALNNPIYDSRDNCNAVIEKSTNKLVVGSNNTVIPNSVTSIGDYAFESRKDITSINIPNSVTSIGFCSFRFCSGLRSINLCEPLVAIGEGAFQECSNLTFVVMPSSLSSVGLNAFFNCKKIKSIMCPAATPPTTGGNCFYNISSSANLFVPESSISAYQSAPRWNALNIRSISDYLTLTATSDNTVIGIDLIGSPNISTLQYSYDGSNWNNITGATTFNTLQYGEFIKFRSSNQISQSYNYIQFNDASGSYAVSGNINTLIKYTDVDNAFLGSYAFYNLFNGCTHLTDASDLLLPSMTLASECYSRMFDGCSSLVTAPVLPAYTLKPGCYRGMFSWCSSLAETPVLPATTMEWCCYESMFNGCSSLTEAPVLPATTLAGGCYHYMFNGCSSLISTPSLAVTNLQYACYEYMFSGCTSLTTAPSLPATIMAEECYSNMFEGCSSLISAPSLPATTLAKECYRFMFRDCTSLKATPILPATTLVDGCYYGMFEYCTSLSNAACYATSWNSEYAENWLNNVSTTGNLYNLGGANIPVGASGIPVGWTEHYSASPTSTITVSANNTNYGTVTGGGTFDFFTTATVTAIPNTGYIFVNWTENNVEVSTDAEYSFTVTEDRNLVANFNIKTFEITASENNSNYGTVSGGGVYDYGETATLTATPRAGCTFINWTENGSVVSTDAEYSFTVTGNRILVANFNGGQYLDEVILGQTYYDWQSNAGARNYTAVWPDGFAAMAWTTSTKTNFTDRGTGIATFDPATGEWTPSAGRVEPVKTGFGSIARYKENGLVVAAHTANDVRIWINEDFRDGGTTWTEVQLYNGSHDACWPVVQCSGENLDIIHILYTDNGATSPYGDPLYYSRYQNGQWTVEHQILPYMDANYISDGNSNMAYFMPYDPAKPNRVAFILNNAWSDGKCMISEDNGQIWSQRVFYQHPNINGDFTDTRFFYPRWTNAAFDADDNLHVVYAYNGSTGTAGSGSYYPQIGGIGYWSETLPKNSMCLGGIGNVGQPFIMDSTYLMQDLYKSEWYWSDANHDPLPEYIGEMEKLDTETHQVVPHEYSGDCFWPETSNWSAHGWFGSGKAEWPSMAYDKSSNTIVAVWSQICGDESTNTYFDGTNYYFRLFYNVSYDGGQTWSGTKHLLTDFTTNYYEMTYPVVIPYIYSDEGGRYVWICAQIDEESGTYVQSEETIYDNNFYKAFKLYIDDAPVVTHYTVTAYANLSNAGTVTGAGNYDAGTTATLTATPNSGYTFVNWTENDEIVSTNATYNFTVNADRNLVANFNAVGTEKHWIPDQTLYADNMSVIGIIQINDEEQRTTDLEIGAFCGDEVRGSQRPQYISGSIDRYIFFLTVYGQASNQITFKLYDHSLGEELDLSSPAAIAFVANGTTGSVGNPHIMNFTSGQDRELTSGWNWYSTYIDVSGASGLMMMENGLGTDAMQIKSQTAFVTYDYGMWYGALTAVNVEQMYMIQMNAAHTLNMSGSVANASAHPISISNGWKWIGYPVNQTMSIDAALANFTPHNGDYIKSQTGFSQYYEGIGWLGALNTLSSGNGYMYQNTSGSAKTLVYATPSKSDALGKNITPKGNHWEPDMYQYANNMSVVAAISVNGEIQNSDNIEVAAFCNGECRGSAKPMFIEQLDKYVAFLTVYGNENDEIVFRLYDAENNEEFAGIADEMMTFSANGTVGSVSTPYLINPTLTPSNYFQLFFACF